MMTRNRPMGFRGRSIGFHSRPAGARDKLNQAYLNGSLILAAFIGLVFNSWWGFGAALASLTILNMIGGNIRFGESRR